MPSQQYQRVDTRDAEPTRTSHRRNISNNSISPPPSFRSNSRSPERRRTVDPDLADAFGSDDSDSDDEPTDRQRLVRHVPGGTSIMDTEPIEGPVSSIPPLRRPPTQPASAEAAPAAPGSRTYGGGMTSDGVFSNLSAKPDTHLEKDELPPTYEQAAADQAPPYWETTIMAPYGGGDEVYIDGMPVGNIFGFLWNAVVSWSFQIVGFLLTYLLHSTHAAKNGSRAGLGVTLIQYGISMKEAAIPPTPEDGSSGNSEFPTPPDPNSHDFKPGDIDSGSGGGWTEMTGTEWFAYMLMVVGMFMLMRSIVEFLQAKKCEQLVLQSPDRGLPVPIVASGETPEQAV